MKTQRRRVILVPENTALRGLIPQGFLHPKPSFIFILTILGLQTLLRIHIQCETTGYHQKYVDIDEDQPLRSNRKNRIQEGG